MSTQLEKQSLEVYNTRPNPNLSRRDDMQMESRRYRRRKY